MDNQNIIQYLYRMDDSLQKLSLANIKDSIEFAHKELFPAYVFKEEDPPEMGKCWVKLLHMLSVVNGWWGDLDIYWKDYEKEVQKLLRLSKDRLIDTILKLHVDYEALYGAINQNQKNLIWDRRKALTQRTTLSNLHLTQKQERKVML